MKTIKITHESHMKNFSCRKLKLIRRLMCIQKNQITEPVGIKAYGAFIFGAMN
jgi:hypothetical protein